jgi:hypothetical protein
LFADCCLLAARLIVSSWRPDLEGRRDIAAEQSIAFAPLEHDPEKHALGL